MCVEKGEGGAQVQAQTSLSLREGAVGGEVGGSVNVCFDLGAACRCPDFV